MVCSNYISAEVLAIPREQYGVAIFRRIEATAELRAKREQVQAEIARLTADAERISARLAELEMLEGDDLMRAFAPEFGR